MMIKNKFIKVIIILITTMAVLMLCSNKIYADPTRLDDYIQSYQQGLADPTENPDSWKPWDVYQSSEGEIAEKAGEVLGIINVIGIVSSVIVAVLLGIKYMLGSVEEKSEYKKSLPIYILGVLFLVACTTIPNIIYNIMSQFNK